MADDTVYWSYEQVLQELQINRSQLNQLIREGRLREHVVEGETKFRLVEVRDVKRTLEKRPTVVEGVGGVEEPTTDLLADETPAAGSGAEPETEILASEEGSAEKETDVLESTQRSSVVDRDTEILEEEGPIGEELGLAAPTESEEISLSEPLAEVPSASDSALETELELKAAGKEEPAEEDFFDFSDQDEFELEESGEVRTAGEMETLAEEPGAESDEFELASEVGRGAGAGDEDVVTDILDLGVEEEVPEEDLLSEIMDIEEEQGEGVGSGEETDDLTAEITTLEEPTYEDSELGEVLEVEEVEPLEAEFDEDLGTPIAGPVPVTAGIVSGAWVVVLLATVFVMLVASIFTLENSFSPAFSTGLASWANGLF